MENHLILHLIITVAFSQVITVPCHFVNSNIANHQKPFQAAFFFACWCIVDTMDDQYTFILVSLIPRRKFIAAVEQELPFSDSLLRIKVVNLRYRAVE